MRDSFSCDAFFFKIPILYHKLYQLMIDEDVINTINLKNLKNYLR